MSQQDVLDYLKDMIEVSDSWFRVKHIQNGLKERGFGNGVLKGVSDDLVALASFGDIEWRGVGIWSHYKEFRAIHKGKKRSIGKYRSK